MDKLKGGDLRSIGRADEVVSDIQKNRSLFKDVFKGLYSDDPVVRMRSADVVEKIKNGFKEISKRDLPETFPIMKVDTRFYQYEV